MTHVALPRDVSANRGAKLRYVLSFPVKGGRAANDGLSCKDGFILYIHRPHPRKEASKYHVRDARAFLAEIGVTP